MLSAKRLHQTEVFTLQTWITASTSSALTWKMGARTTMATSVQYGDDLSRSDVRITIAKKFKKCFTAMKKQTMCLVLPSFSVNKETRPSPKNV